MPSHKHRHHGQMLIVLRQGDLTMQTNPNRPLGPLSNFVVEELAHVLEDRAQAAARLSAAVETLFPNDALVFTVLAGPALRGLAHLDATMLEAAITHSGGTSPDRLTHLVDDLAVASDQVPMLTYEGLVLVNPPKDLRAFTRGPVGEAERRFYMVHTRIEELLGEVVTGLESAQDAQGQMQEVLRLVSSLRADMDPTHFAAFRQFLTSHPIRRLNGPSGAATAMIPLLELRLWGNWLSNAHRESITRILRYMPRADRPRVQAAFETASHVCSATDSARLGQLVPFAEFLYAFRGGHLGAVARHVPEALRGTTAGTGGVEDPGTFLRGLLTETKDLLGRLKQAAH